MVTMLVRQQQAILGRYSSDIQQKAGTIDVGQIVSMVKGV
jgi:hypothetical protein